MSWKVEVLKTIHTLCPIGGTFSLDDIYQFRPHFQELYPNNHHIDDKIRQTLQYLRDDNLIEFIGNSGVYQRLK